MGVVKTGEKIQFVDSCNELYVAQEPLKGIFPKFDKEREYNLNA
jgi:hypothetical protein